MSSFLVLMVISYQPILEELGRIYKQIFTKLVQRYGNCDIVAINALFYLEGDGIPILLQNSSTLARASFVSLYAKTVTTESSYIHAVP